MQSMVRVVFIFDGLECVTAANFPSKRFVGAFTE
jgi:hypothetical protein